MIAANRQHRGMHHGAAVKHDDVGGAAADIDQRDAEFALLRKQRRVGRRERLENHLRRRHARALAALGEILSVALRRGDDMNARLEPHARHAVRLAHALLLIDGELLRQNMQHLAIERDRDRARRVDHAIDIARADFAAAHRDDSVAVEAPDMRSRDADDDRADAHAGSFLRFLDRRFDRFDRRFDIDDDALAQPGAWRDAEAERRQLTVGQRLADDRADFAGADVQSGEQISHRVTGSPTGWNETF